jgi:hypothetical protein
MSFISINTSESRRKRYKLDLGSTRRPWFNRKATREELTNRFRADAVVVENTV